MAAPPDAPTPLPRKQVELRRAPVTSPLPSPARRAHPADLPALKIHLGGRVIVLAVDANMIMRDLHLRAAKPESKAPALLELVQAPQVRVVMSALDLRDLTPSVSRLEANIRKKHPRHADAMMALWHEAVRPHLYVLDPAGLPETTLSRQVRSQARDPDDADLIKLASVVKADALLSYDEEAFDGLIRVLVQKGEHGDVLSAFRDDLRIEQMLALSFGAPVVLTGYTLQSFSQSLARRGVSWQAQAAAAALLVGALAAWPQARQVLGRAASATWKVLDAMQPDPAVHAQIRELTGGFTTEWPVIDDPVALVVRHLIRQPRSVSCTALVKELRLPLSAGQLYARLEAAPGLVELMPGRRWQVRRG